MNLTLLPKLVRRNAAFKILDKSTALSGSDWGNGGCLVLAMALLNLVDGRLYGIKSKNGYEHAVVRVGHNKYLDHDGVRTRKDTQAFWTEEFKAFTDTWRLPVSLVPVSLKTLEARGIVYDEAVVEELTNYLRS